MKNSIWKKGLTLALAAMVLTTSVSLPADAAAAAPVAETQETQPGGEADRKSTRLNSSHLGKSRMPSSA